MEPFIAQNIFFLIQVLQIHGVSRAIEDMIKQLLDKHAEASKLFQRALQQDFKYGA
jgi:hypothetical protein